MAHSPRLLEVSRPRDGPVLDARQAAEMLRERRSVTSGARSAAPDRSTADVGLASPYSSLSPTPSKNLADNVVEILRARRSGTSGERSPAPDGSTADVGLASAYSDLSPTPSKSLADNALSEGLREKPTEVLVNLDSPNSRGYLGGEKSTGVCKDGKIDDPVVQTSFIQADFEIDEEPDSWLRMKVRFVIESGACEAFIACIVLLNLGLTVVETDSRAAGKQTDPWIQKLLVVCFALVILEVCVRVYVERKKLLQSPFAWLDVFIIFSGFLDYAIQMTGLGGIGVVRTLRIFRLFRLVRVILHLKFFNELAKLLQMMGSCFRTLFWSFLLMGFVMTLWGTVAVEAIHPVVLELVEEHGEFQQCPRCRTAFSTVLNADLTLFQTIVAGDSWGQMALPVIAYEPWTMIIFLGSLLTLVFGVLNMIVAVVVDTSAEIRAKDIVGRGCRLEYEEVEEKRALTKMFKRIDTDSSGSISYDELKEGARKVTEFRHWLRVLDIDASDLKELFEFIDEDHNGSIEPREFIEYMYRFKNAESKTTSKFVKHQLSKLEKQQVGFEETVKANLENVKSRVAGFESIMTTGFSNVQKGVKAQVVTSGVGGDDEMHQRLLEQIDSMESAFQEATREALEIALRTAAETTRHLLEAANASNRQAALAVPKPPKAVEDAKAAPSEEADAWRKAVPSRSWWAEAFSPRRLPSEDSKVECPPTTAGLGRDGGDDNEPADMIVPEPRATSFDLVEGGLSRDVEVPCQELRGPNGASTGPPRPFLPGGFQPRAPRLVFGHGDDLEVGRHPERGAGLVCEPEQSGDGGGRGSGTDAGAGPRAGMGRRSASTAGRRGPRPPSSRP